MTINVRFCAKKFFGVPVKLAQKRTFCLFLCRIFVVYVQKE